MTDVQRSTGPAERVLERPSTRWEQDSDALLGTRRETGGYREIVRIRLVGVGGARKPKGTPAKH